MRGYALMFMLCIVTTVMGKHSAGYDLVGGDDIAIDSMTSTKHKHLSSFDLVDGDDIEIDSNSIKYDYQLEENKEGIVYTSMGTISLDILPFEIDNISYLQMLRDNETIGDATWPSWRELDFTSGDNINIHVEIDRMTWKDYFQIIARDESNNSYRSKWIFVKDYMPESDLDLLYKNNYLRYDDAMIDEPSVEYLYQLTREDSKVVCHGIFSFIASVPDKVVSAWVEYSPPKRKGIWGYMKYNKELALTPGAEFVMVEEPDVEWGTFYRVKFLDEDGFKIYSQIINTSDYISEADMRKIQNNDVTSVETVADDDEAISVSGGVLTVCPETPATVRIYDLSGRCLLDRQVTEYTQIPLDAYARGPLIIQMHDGETSHTLKAFAR